MIFLHFIFGILSPSSHSFSFSHLVQLTQFVSFTYASFTYHSCSHTFHIIMIDKTPYHSHLTPYIVHKRLIESKLQLIIQPLRFVCPTGVSSYLIIFPWHHFMMYLLIAFTFEHALCGGMQWFIIKWRLISERCFRYKLDIVLIFILL